MFKITNPFVNFIISFESMREPTIPAYLPETYSQCGEDLFLKQYLDAYFFRKNSNPFNMKYLEIGANHPVCTSSTWLLHNHYGTTGILVEPIPKLAEQLRIYRVSDEVVEAAVIPGKNSSNVTFYVGNQNEVSSVDKNFTDRWCENQEIIVPTININDLLHKLSDAEYILLFIDIEGLDIQVLEEIQFDKVRPFIIQIEPSDWYNNDGSYRIYEFMLSKNYKLICKNIVNMMFIDQGRE